MKRITEDYCSPRVSKILREKGLGKEHFSHYVQVQNGDGTIEAVGVCTHQIAMKFLRDVYDIHISVNKSFLINDIDNKPYLVYVCTKKCHTSYNAWSEYHSTYEEAVEAALKHVLLVDVSILDL